MFKKILPLALLLGACGAQVASAEPLVFKEQRAGVSHSLQIKNLKMDARGVPSFEYAYVQQGAGCRYAISGKAVAGFEEAGGKIELEVYNPEGPGGKETGPILAFHDGEVNFTVARKEPLHPKSVSFDTMLDDAARSKNCNKKADRLEILFKKRAG